MKKWQYGAAVALTAAMVAAAPQASASPFDVYGAGARSTAMGGAQTANAEGASAVYDNVAGLAESDAEIRIGAFATFLDAPILLMDRPDGYDVPDLGARSQALPSDQTARPRSDSDGPRPIYGVHVGAVTDFGDTRTRGGVLVMLPTNGLMDLQTHFPDERERYFSNQLHHEIVGSRIHRPVIEMGVARPLTERISFGVGGSYLPTSVVTTHAYVRDPGDQSDVDLNADVHTGNHWGFVAGLTAKLIDDLKVGLVYRGGVDFRIEGGNQIQVRGLEMSDEESHQEIDWVPLSTPSSLRAGLSWGVGDVELTLDGRYVFWSSHLNTQAEPAGFRDIAEGRAGVEWTSSDDTRLRAGGGFIPSPVPAQTGRTNYVDNSRILGSVGGAHRFELWDRDMEASWFVQFQHLLRRETHKRAMNDYPVCAPGEDALCDEVPDDIIDPGTGQYYPEAQGLQTGNPGFPGFVSGGWLGAVGLELRY